MVIPTGEARPRAKDRRAEENQPGRAKLRLIAELRRAPLRCGPHAREDDRENDEDLADQQLGRCQELAPGRTGVSLPGKNRTDRCPRDIDARLPRSCFFAVRGAGVYPNGSIQPDSDISDILAKTVFRCNNLYRRTD